MRICVESGLKLTIKTENFENNRDRKTTTIMEEEELIHECQFCGKKLRNDKGYCDSKCLDADMQ